MFHSARLKLTAWYLVIIMVISVAFSVAIYRLLSNELERFARMQRFKIERRFREVPFPSNIQRLPIPEPELVNEVKSHLKIILVLINGGILILAGGVGYFLAGRTLRPIKDMVEEQNRFIADASHEFRTPLTALKSNIEVSLLDKKITLAETKQVLKDSLVDVNQLQALSDALLRLAQNQEQNGNHQIEEVSIKKIAEDSVRKVAKLSEKKHIIIHNEVQEHTIRGDAGSLSELLVILLDNAIKYSPASSAVTISSKNTDSHIKLYVRDQGQGIDEKDLPHIFDRFYRADKSRSKQEMPGYGLGLSIAKKIVTAHGGSIEVKTQMKKGTTFIITVPIKRE